MTISLGDVQGLTDEDLLARVQRAASTERRATAQLIALLMELDSRRLYLAEGCSSLFTYCTQVLRLSEHAAYGRIEAARAARRFPVILGMLADGSINLTAIGLLAQHLTPANHRDVLDGARHKSKREVEHLVAGLQPRPDTPASIRKLPETSPSLSLEGGRPDDSGSEQATPFLQCVAAPRAHSEIKPLTPERYKIQFTVGRETYECLRRVQDLVRHTIPNGDPAAIFDRALKLLFAQLSKSKVADAEYRRAPASAIRRSRHIPASIRRAVWRRDDGRCAFVGTQGRCAETGFLEFHHVLPFADGGSTTVDNLELRCRAHNVFEADRWFGAGELPLLRESHCSYGSLQQLGPDRVAEAASTPLRQEQEMS